MIYTAEQFLALRGILEEAATDSSVGELQHGVLLAVPAACLNATGVVQTADFDRIGVKDLMQHPPVSCPLGSLDISPLSALPVSPAHSLTQCDQRETPFRSNAFAF